MIIQIGQGEYWGITVETKNKEKTFKLASELVGLEGRCS